MNYGDDSTFSFDMQHHALVLAVPFLDMVPTPKRTADGEQAVALASPVMLIHVGVNHASLAEMLHTVADHLAAGAVEPLG